MRKIFISYRRSDAEYAAGALGRELRRYFGEEQVFRDKEDIGGGVSWKQQVLHEIDHDSALLVLIGREWAAARDTQGRRRLDNTDDPIRLEIADGIKDQAAVIPVLLENAQMPGESDLPPELLPMAEFNAVKLRDSDWQYDLDHICRTLVKAGFKPASATAQAGTAAGAAPSPQRRAADRGQSRGFPIKLIASYVIGVLALIGFKETHDSDTYWGLALFSLIALVLAILAYRDYQQGRSNSMWPAIGAIALGALGTLGYTGWALDPKPGPNADSGSTSADKTPVAATPPAPIASLGATAPNAARPAPANVAAPSQMEQPARAVVPPTAASESRIQEFGDKLPGQTQAPNISGRWKDSEDDTAIVFTQQGNQVHMVATQQGIAVEGNGTLSGRKLQMNLLMAGLPLGELRLTLSPDGRALRGTMVTQGQTEQILFIR